MSETVVGKRKPVKYSPILPGTEDWPVVQLSRNRKQFIQEIITESELRVKGITINRNALIDELESTLYTEMLRVKKNPWKVDPEDEYAFWHKIKSNLLNLTNDSQAAAAKTEEKLLKEIISRYTEEIAGNFKPSHYRLARTLVTYGFSRLLNAARIKKFGAFWRNDYTLQDKIHITGEMEHVRELAKKGTVIMVPTHFSNLDSILIGWVIHTLGLPPFIYGAGLNLFNISIFAYFMNSLGAYKVDRRKKNVPYLETLKSYSSMAIRKGCHSLFFPGGTRSRSGSIENKLKLGLLGTAIEAQRMNYEQDGDKAKKVFIVPVVLNYHFVLEAPSLIHEHLAQQGQERYYYENDEYSTSYKIFKFMIQFFTKGSDISVSIGKPMDVLGNPVDKEGNSLDPHNRIIDTKDYFTSNQKVTRNKQREDEYTRMLSHVIVKRYHEINRVFSSHLVAFVAFEIIKKRHPRLDLFNLLRLPEEEQVISYDEFKAKCQLLATEILQRKEKGQIDVASHFYEDLDELIAHGLSNVGMYHSKRPLIRDKKGNITTQDLATLYYYHNRLDGYGFEKFIK
ncbi:1-acyl-sn-glycerol-3-phosphate acyltransferase [Cytophagales bacterium LB-30]|uniref:Glycerol-3-phosphate acyltransferase n=1 Tax=Shiella aurantiaca TaxID=3058365 RepID=A0ABT8F9N6_9BACT|nr:1-acyl-sn-glycerol-3-phosphate acyltransferase [Shiella aurantiaca]MDN4166964.1 1-acyl-sn-glycerol-3-phosphate acyltransferase [Shiella aurantiaca]